MDRYKKIYYGVYLSIIAIGIILSIIWIFFPEMTSVANSGFVLQMLCLVTFIYMRYKIHKYYLNKNGETGSYQ